MPVRDRKFFIAKHNGAIDEEKKKKQKSKSVDGPSINAFTDMSQGQGRNMR